MADERLVKLLVEGGIREWNAFRAEKIDDPVSRIDLREANLDSINLAPFDFPREDLSSVNVDALGENGVDLCDVDLSNADLRNAKLDGACLQGASLLRAKLDGANLVGAALHDADVRGASFVEADLAHANFDHARLHYAKFHRARLHRAKFRYATVANAKIRDADLSKAYCRSTDFSEADLRSTDFTGAELRDARFRFANLSGANLSGASLAEVDFIRTKLKDTNFHGARMGATVVVGVDLQDLEGLESVEHLGPSHISALTLAEGRGHNPIEFLRGCGLADWEIEAAKLYNPDLDEDERTTILYEISRIQGQQPFAMYRVFISYSRTDEPFVEAIEERFDSKGIRYWRDVHDMKAGRIEKQIDRAITLNRRVLLVLSERSVLSDWVEWEATKAREVENEYRREGKHVDTLCPVALDDAWKTCDWPGPLRKQIEKYNILDFSDWQDDAAFDHQFSKLYDGLILNYQG